MYLYFIIILLIVFSAYLWHGKKHLARKLLQCGNAGSGRRYKELFENTSDAIFVIEVTRGGQFRFDSFNSAAAQIIDPYSDSIVGQPLNKILKRSGDPELQRIIWELSAHLTRAINSGMPVKYESTFHFSLKEIPGIYEISLVPMADDGGITHIFCFARDVTAIKLYEQELLVRVRLEEKLSSFAASAPGFFYSFQHGANGSNSMPFASAGINDLFGLHPEEVAQNISPMTLLIHRDDLKFFIDATASSAADLSPLAIEFRTQHPGKAELWVEARALPQLEQDGSVIWHGFMHEVSERKLYEQSLLERAELEQRQLQFSKDTQDKLRELMYSRETGREEERKRIAWEMHEELGQLLAATKMRVYGLRTQFPKNNPSINEESRVILSLLDKSIKTIRDIVSDLRPSVLQHGPAAALEWLVQEFSKRSDIDCKLEIKEDDTLASDELTTLAFRVVQEILQYIERYPGVSRVVVAWVSNQENQTLTIRHDGAAIIDDKSLSLFGIQERVTSFGGTMQMFSDFEHVLVIEITFPVRGVEEIQYPVKLIEPVM